MKDPRSILITGASSGIGEALARAYAAPGMTLALSGRDMARTEAVTLACRDAGAATEGAVLDVTDADMVAAWVADSDRRAPLDLVIANAGISASGSGAGEDEQQVRRIIAVNVNGVLHTVLPALSRMRDRGRGQIAIVSSLAGFRGYPGAPAYCASKAAVKSWGEALRGSAHGDGIEVSVICPGFVRTRMTEKNDFPMPFVMNADRAAAIIRRGLARNRGRIAFPLPMFALAWLFAALPAWLVDPLLRTLPAKE